MVEDRYSAVFKLTRVRPAQVADGLAEIQIRWPAVPILFAETRQLAEEWTYRFLAAARLWADTEPAAIDRLPRLNGATATDLDRAPSAPDPLDGRGARLGTGQWPDRPRPGKTRAGRLGGVATRQRSYVVAEARCGFALRAHATPEHASRLHEPGDEDPETVATQLPVSVPLAVGAAVALDCRYRHRSRGHSPGTGFDRTAPGFGRQHVARPPRRCRLQSSSVARSALDIRRSITNAR